MRIFIIWSDMTGLRKTGRTVTRDRNHFPEFEAAKEGHAALWRWDATEADLPKAEAYAKQNGWSVYTTDENDFASAKAAAQRHAVDHLEPVE